MFEEETILAPQRPETWHFFPDWKELGIQNGHKNGPIG